MSKQILIAADQLINTFIPPYSGDNRGWADETLSSRSWRRSADSKAWSIAKSVIDWVFLMLINERDHCFESWVSESLRRHMPPELRKEGKGADQ